jgi:AraC-like DNA-binding protein
VLDPPPGDFRVLRFRSDTVARAQRVTAWREILARKLLRVDVEPLPGHPFQINASLRILSDVRFGYALCSAATMRRTRRIVAHENDDLLIVVSAEGVLTVSGPDGEIVLQEGDGIVTNCTGVQSFARRAVGRLLCARFRRAAVAELVPNLDAAQGRFLPRGTEGLRLLTNYLRELDDSERLTNPKLRAHVTGQILDTLAFVLRPLCEYHNPHAARLNPIKTYIGDNLAKPDLSIGDVAAFYQMSERQLQRLFEAEDMTFSGFVLGLRLERVHLALKDPRRVHRGIGEIALGCGFADLSYFNRAFRRRYKVSPSILRGV